MHKTKEMYEQDKLSEQQRNMSVMCKCGRRNHFYPFEKKHKICSWCNNMVFATKEEEFRYRTMEQMKRQRRKDRD